jgi:nitrite reductase/ring-hydroxylating ferredoxin subunit
MSTLLRLCAVEELTPGSRLVVEIAASEEVLVLNIAGTVYAMSNVCPHAGAALQRRQLEGTVLYCLLHRSLGFCTLFRSVYR